MTDNHFGLTTELLDEEDAYRDDGTGSAWYQPAPPWAENIVGGECTGGNYYEGAISLTGWGLASSPTCVDPTTSFPPSPHPFGLPVRISGTAGSVDLYPLVEVAP